jgi:hypothetical protein
MRFLSLALLLALGACAPAPIAAPPPDPPAAARGSIAGPLLAAHNRERAAAGAAPLRWDPALATAATTYARQLAREGRLRHAPKAQRPKQGENLWIGTAGAYPMEAMAGSWSAERRHFRPGRFPAVSRTGNWADTGHFTQMIWPTTRRLGCGIGRSVRWEVLVCRYSPAGNVDGAWLPG